MAAHDPWVWGIGAQIRFQAGLYGGGGAEEGDETGP